MNVTLCGCHLVRMVFLGRKKIMKFAENLQIQFGILFVDYKRTKKNVQKNDLGDEYGKLQRHFKQKRGCKIFRYLRYDA